MAYRLYLMARGDHYIRQSVLPHAEFNFTLLFLLLQRLGLCFELLYSLFCVELKLEFREKKKRKKIKKPQRT